MNAIIIPIPMYAGGLSEPLTSTEIFIIGPTIGFLLLGVIILLGKITFECIRERDYVFSAFFAFTLLAVLWLPIALLTQN